MFPIGSNMAKKCVIEAMPVSTLLAPGIKAYNDEII